MAFDHEQERKRLSRMLRAASQLKREVGEAATLDDAADRAGHHKHKAEGLYETYVHPLREKDDLTDLERRHLDRKETEMESHHEKAERLRRAVNALTTNGAADMLPTFRGPRDLERGAAPPQSIQGSSVIPCLTPGRPSTAARAATGCSGPTRRLMGRGAKRAATKRHRRSFLLIHRPHEPMSDPSADQATLFDDQERRHVTPEGQPDRVAYEDEPDPKEVRDDAYDDVDLTAKQEEYMRCLFGWQEGEKSQRLFEQRVEVERMMWGTSMLALTDMEAARILDWPRSSVNGRRNELVNDLYLMEAAEKRECRVTGETAVAWRPVADLWNQPD